MHDDFPTASKISQEVAMTPHPTNRHTPRLLKTRAFTLTELLVVVAIIGMILALLSPVVFNARTAAINAKTKVEVDLLHTALMNYRNEYGSFPPADMSRLWNPSTNSVNTNDAAYKHLARAFPQMKEITSGTASPFYHMSQMSPAQALVFWLRGFYPNRQYPLTNGVGWPGGGGERNKLFDFDDARLYAVASPYDFNTPQSFVPQKDVPVTDPRRVYPVYFTGHQNAGAPYVYFDSRCYSTDLARDLAYKAISRTTGEPSIAKPYFNSNITAGATWAQAHINGDTFQLIAPGNDGKYGDANPVAFPGSLPIDKTLTIPAVTNTASSAGHLDNITNFASGALDASARKAAEQK